MKTSKVNLQNTIADKAIFGLTIELLFVKTVNVVILFHRS